MLINSNMKKRDTKQLAKKGRNETSQQLLESMAVKNKDLFFYHEKPDSLIVTCRLCGHDHADATDVLSHLKDCVQAFKTDYCSKCFYRAPYF